MSRPSWAEPVGFIDRIRAALVALGFVNCLACGAYHHPAKSGGHRCGQCRKRSRKAK